MKRLASIATLLLGWAVALANNCRREMKAIDAALPEAKLEAAKLSEVQKLRAKGEGQPHAGCHAESMAALGKAKGMLGIR